MSHFTDNEIILTLGLDQEPKRFSRLDELSKWIEDQKEFWGFMASLDSAVKPKELWNGSCDKWRHIEVAIQHYNEAQEGQKQTSIDELKGAMQRYPYDGIRLEATDCRAQYVKRISETDPVVASYALAHFVKPELAESKVPGLIGGAVGGAVAAIMFRHMLADDKLESIERALQQEQTEWKNFVNRSRTDYEQTLAKYQDFTTRHEAFHEDQKTQLTEMFKTAENELDGIRRRLKEELALQEPVDYWQAKKRQHDLWTKVFAPTFVILFLAGTGLVYIGVDYLLKPVTSTTAVTDMPQEQHEGLLSQRTETGIFRLAVVLIGVGLVVWPIRLVVRLLMSNIHLSTEAQERMTMTNTYLAFLEREDKGGLSEEDRQLVLSVLFRPSTTGVVSDDASPTSPSEALMKFFGKH